MAVANPCGPSGGAAMLEIIHDLAPGAELYFATAFGGPASFAQNILNLRAAGCDIIVDDVGYANESPFQDGPIAQAVSDVGAAGVLYFLDHKTDPGAYNLPLYLAFADVMNTPGLILAPKMGKGFRFIIMDVNYTEGDRVIELNTPENIYDIATLLRDPERFVVESIWSRASGEQAAAVSTSRLHNIAGKYTGKDDPVMLVRAQMNFPATGEILSPFHIGHFVAGGMRGSHNMPLMPVRLKSPVSYFDGPPVVSCAAFSMHEGRLTGPIDAFDHPFWDTVRQRVSEKAIEMRKQGFVGAAMLPMAELEYTGIVERLKALEGRFTVRTSEAARAA